MSKDHNNTSSESQSKSKKNEREISPTVGDVGTFNIQLAMDLGDVDLAIMVQFFVNIIAQHKRLGRNQRS